MNCISCNARLAPSSTHCFFCGGKQPDQNSVRVKALGHGGGNGAEYWRVWASFLVGGVYAPFASRYLFRREEWALGHQVTTTMPQAPSKKLWFPLCVALGLPMLTALAWGLVFDYASASRTLVESPMHYAESLEAVARGLSYNLAIGLFFVLSLIYARDVERRLESLLVESTSRDPSALLRFREGHFRRMLAYAFSLAPCAVIVREAVRVSEGEHSLTLGLFYPFAIAGAAWASSWLHIHAIHRYRRGVNHASP